MSRKLSIITLTLAILAIALSAFTLLSSKNTAGSESRKHTARVTEAATAKEAMDTAGEEEGDIQYVLYLGLSRPDDGSMLTFEEGKEKLQPILVKHFFQVLPSRQLTVDGGMTREYIVRKIPL